jgi:hypothetical protein
MHPKLEKDINALFDKHQNLKFKMLKPAPYTAQCFRAYAQVGGNMA